jgi:hypothetical protein
MLRLDWDTIKMKKTNQMALDIIALNNNVILDPDKVKKHAMKENPGVTDWLKRNTIGGFIRWARTPWCRGHSRS